MGYNNYESKEILDTNAIDQFDVGKENQLFERLKYSEQHVLHLHARFLDFTLIRHSLDHLTRKDKHLLRIQCCPSLK